MAGDEIVPHPGTQPHRAQRCHGGNKAVDDHRPPGRRRPQKRAAHGGKVKAANLGQYIGAGTKIGQINSEGSYKIEAKIDEHYIDRVVPGLDATFERQSEKYDAQVRKVYPEVRDGKFQADFKFEGQQPDNIRTGQTYYLNLQLGQPERAVLIPRGTFYQKTGGKWIYVVSKDGGKAVKREIRIGRQNPQFYEVLEGLEPGEKVITSSYDNYGDSDVLVF